MEKIKEELKAYVAAAGAWLLDGRGTAVIYTVVCLFIGWGIGKVF